MTSLKNFFFVGLIWGLFFVSIPSSFATMQTTDIYNEQYVDLTTLEDSTGKRTISDFYYYASVVVASYQALNSKLNNAALEKVSHAAIKLGKKESDIFFSAKFGALKFILKTLLNKYSDVMYQSDKYSIRAFYYRVLIWLKFHLRHEHTPNETVESIIDNMIIMHDLKNVLDKIKIIPGLYPNPFMRYTDKEIWEIKNSKDLKTFGQQEDLIVEYCLQLAKDKKRSYRRSEIEIPFPDKVYLIENFLTEVSNYDEKSFREQFLGKSADEILVYLYEHVCENLSWPCKRVDAKSIDLNRKDSSEYNLMENIRDIMILYGRAVNKMMLYGRSENTRRLDQLEMFRVQSIPLQVNTADTAKNALYHLQLKSLMSLSNAIVNTFNSECVFDNSSSKMSCCLIPLLSAVHSIDDEPQGHWKNPYKYESDEFYLNITTLEDLKTKLCDQ